MPRRAPVACFALLLGALACPPSSSLRAAEIVVERYPADAAVVEFDEPYQSVRAGAGGRLLIFHLPKANRLAVVDVAAGKIAASIPVASADIVYSAGRDKLFVAQRDQKLLHRYRLGDFKREKTISLSTAPNVVLIGCDSRGPLLVWTRRQIELWDAETLRPLPPTPDHMLVGDPEYKYQLRVSADGQTFVGWPGGFGSPFDVIQLDGNRSKLSRTPDALSYNGRWAQPSADGDLLLRSGPGLYSRDMRPISTDALSGAILLPTADPRFLLALRGENEGASSSVEILTASDRRPICKVAGLGVLAKSGLKTEQGVVSGRPRVYFLPGAHLLVALPEGNRRVCIHPLKLSKILKQSGEDYLVVVSKPPPEALVGETYRYQIETLASAKRVDYRLESGPEGMRVSERGLVRWPVKRRPLGGKVTVLVTLTTESGRELFHTFTLRVSRPSHSARPRGGEPKVTDGPNMRRADEGVGAKRREEPKAAGEFFRLDERRLEAPAGALSVAPGLKGLLALCGSRLAVLGPDGALQKQFALEKNYRFIGERDAYYVALADDPQSIDLLDKRSLEVLKSRKLGYQSLTGLALHPNLPVSYVAFKDAINAPRYHFLVFDEKTGEARDSPDYIGKWLACGPRGGYLVAGYSDIYRQGSRLLINPDRFHVVPKYGSLDWLLTYRLDRDGMPSGVSVREKVGGNGSGLRLSADGERAAYPSHVGSPPFSRNLAGYDPRDLSKLPVIYELKDKGSTQELAFHPALPLVAAIGSAGPLFFDRETGAPQPDRLKESADALRDGKIERIYFSPDGRWVIFDLNINAIHYLHRLPLKLTAAEIAKLDATPRGAAPPRRPKARVPLKEFDALAGGRGKPMTPQDISREFMDAVAIVQTEHSSGTGFVVGRHGYLLTCAHCVAENSPVTVSLRHSRQGKVESREYKAEIVRRDAQLDLALLKIKTRTPLRAVRLAPLAAVSNGERVSAIGNPGAGDTILDYTITEGIVSSARRKIDGQTLIQTSAAVNPGSSGGPLFNARGQVVGLVALKARIEGAGFAVPAATLTKFLIDAASTNGPDGALARTWIDASGRYEISAVLGKLEHDRVELRDGNGKTVTVPLDKLSEADQQFLKLLGEKSRP